MTGPGLHDKYYIFRSIDASPVDYPCFVLRVDGADEAAMKALREYANHTACPDLAADLHDHIARFGGGGQAVNPHGPTGAVPNLVTFNPTAI